MLRCSCVCLRALPTYPRQRESLQAACLLVVEGIRSGRPYTRGLHRRVLQVDYELGWTLPFRPKLLDVLAQGEEQERQGGGGWGRKKGGCRGRGAGRGGRRATALQGEEKGRAGGGGRAAGQCWPGLLRLGRLGRLGRPPP